MFSYLEKIIDPFKIEEVETPPSNFWGFVWYYTKPVSFLLLIVAVFAAAIAIVEVIIFTFMGDLVNWLSTEDPETFFADNWGSLVWMGVVLLVIAPAVNIIWELFFHQGLVGNYPMLIRWKGHRQLLRQSLSFFSNDFAGRVANKLMQTSLAVREVITRIVDIFVYVVVYFLAALVVLAGADWRLALPMVGWLASYFLVMYIFVPRLKQISKKQADARSLMTGHIVDAYTNISTVKLFSHAAREEDYAKGSMSKFLGTVHQQMRNVTKLNVCLSFINNLLLLSLGATSIWLWQGSLVTTGDIALSIGLALRLQGMSQWILWEVAGLFENIGTVQDGLGMLSKHTEVADKDDAKELVVSKAEISFEDVKFHYGKGSGVLEQLTLSIKSGEKIGIVGRSGAGKSTLMNLLLRFHDLEGGHIKIDGQDIRGVTQESLRQHIGVVSQDTSLLHRTILENITYGKDGASFEQAQEAARRAHAWEFISDLKDPEGRTGFNTLVGERGVKLSGGQRQRVAIARVLLKDAPILVLDEATSALDSEVEAAIQGSLFELMEGKTVIAIAHRLSTIAAMDRLIVMDQGKIVEMGTHEELVQSQGIYENLWNHQSGGFLAQAAAE
ncbi:putative multidrug export ATP-binding/permease protein [Pseudovibrio axinellae]|uniref:Putative multidrug export ATP-binding/permease protein n=1 Tax=Pseudovibrio axinellae TaxID=989403 RepID=A0A165XU55_9HYPH|nr:ABC transporter ATP-binding protein [Pseudovibrio axinellae]KZL18043.1 putative multidrug export ATP-binding/permease protein [Pseudovibrio axinellae]SER12452.1 ATP-binding cassette, subfamily B, multidrug efflux pump [Pseudovibrio axinellae]